jgi:N-acetylglucosaminyl-diphospho-decaprenol L-rhamnosyltransferase
MGFSVSAIIVNYHNIGVSLENCIDSLLIQTVPVSEILIVNNGDDNELTIKDSRVKIVNFENKDEPENVGFGKAVNYASKLVVSTQVVEDKLIFLINPDAVLEKDCLQKLLSNHNRKNITAPVIKNSDGSVYASARIEPDSITAGMHALLSTFSKNNRWSKRYKKLIDVSSGKLTKVDWCSGAAMLFHKDLFLSLDGFDEQFFMYLEDVDLCKRVLNAGGEIIYVHSANVMHLGAVSSQFGFKTRFMTLREHHKSALIYYGKWATGTKRWLSPIAALTLLVRFSFETCKLVLKGRKK